MGLPINCAISLHHAYEKGARNLITDVQGVTVGQVTLTDEARGIHTGVTAVRPHPGNVFREKVPAGAAVLNGFGKTTGLVQLEELGTLETPILLTNTLSVGTALTALTRYMLEENPDIGVGTGTVNGIVAECNDGSLNDIRGLHVTEAHVRHALEHCSESFEEGAVGAGTGMCCMGLKGGIGSASRLLPIDGQTCTVGALVLSNFGVAGNLRIDGVRMPQTAQPPKRADIHVDTHTGANTDADSCTNVSSGRPRRSRWSDFCSGESQAEHGSIIILLATDLPLSDRQLKRMARRSAAALGRTGSYLGNGSGDIAIAFSTANRVPHYGQRALYETKAFRDDAIDPVFEATVEAVEEAILSSLYHAPTTKGIRGKLVYGLRDYLGSDRFQP